MKIKILVLALVFLFLLSCENSPENPFSPEIFNPKPLLDPAYDFQVTMGVNANITTFSNENDYATFYLTFVGINAGFFSVTNDQPNNSITKTLTVNYIDENSEWGENANFRLFQAGSSVNLEEFSGYCWLKIIPISEDVNVGPVSDCGNTVDINGETQVSFNGWELGEYKAIYFRISKK